MDVSLNQVIEVREKSQDAIEEENASNINAESEEEQRSMPENGNTSQSGSGFQYQIRNPDNGQVTYRVVQVGGDENNQQATLSIVTTNGMLNQLSQDENSGGTSPQVAIVGNPFNNESTNETSSGTESSPSNQRFTYFQGTSGGTELNSPTSTGTPSSGQTDQQLLSSGQFYVMMSPQEVIQSGGTPSTRTILSRASFQSRGDDDSSKNTRDVTRRVQHNEVERRRRDKINNWILKLAAIIPDCANDHTKQGQSKGGVLAKACDYIVDLQAANTQLTESLKECEQLQMNYEMCRQQLEEANKNIQQLHQTLQAHQIELPEAQQTQ